MVIRALLIFLFFALPAHADSLRIILPKMRPVAGEMIPVTIRGEYTGRISLEKMTFPDSESYDWIQVARDVWADELIEGKRFRTFERRIAVFPRQPGTFSIGPVTHRLTKSETGTWLEGEVTAPAVSIPVMAYPASGRPLVAREVEIRDEFTADPAKLHPEESFTRRITVIAQGTMAHFLPDRPNIDQDWLVSFAAPEIRETRLTLEGPVAVAVWEWTLRPRTGETGALAPIQILFYNPLIREMRGAFTLPVEVGEEGSAGNIAGAARPPERMGWEAAAIAGAGLVLALLLGLWGRGFGSRKALRQRIKRLMPNPHRHALAEAAKGDLAAFRGLARDYAAHEVSVGRSVDAGALAALDEAAYGRAGGEPDRASLLARLRRSR